MAVAVIATDTWIQHLPFQGGPRQTVEGPVDGVWYGLVSGDGDASGGNLTLNGSLSFDRKEDWVYILKGFSATNNDPVVNMEMFLQANTGPLIPTASAVQNPSFNFGGALRGIDGNAIAIMNEAGASSPAMPPFPGLPIFGDKRISGTFLMLAAGFAINTDTVTYQMSAWGWLVRYQGFFRRTNPALG